MKRKLSRGFVALCALLLLMSTAAFAVETADVQSAVNTSGKEAVTGNVFVWFLCAISFLKVSQKLDEILNGLGIHVGRTGTSMLSEMLFAGKGIAMIAQLASSGFASFFAGGAKGGGGGAPTGTAPTASGGGGGVMGGIRRAVGKSAVSSATGRSTGGMGSAVVGSVFNSSLGHGGSFANSVIGRVATGSIAETGSITGEKANEALQSYLGYKKPDSSAPGAASASVPGSTSDPGTPPISEGDSIKPGEDIITINGGTAGGSAPTGQDTSHGPASGEPSPAPAKGQSRSSIPGGIPTFRDVEIGGGRIVGYETPAGGGQERQFAMYSASQYMEPSTPFEKVQSADGETWYKQYARPIVQKTPYKGDDGKIQYSEEIVQQMPQIPKRKDKV